MTGAPGRPRQLHLPQTQREADLLRVSLEYLWYACRLVAWRCNVHAQAIEDAQGRRRYVHSLPKGFADIAVVVPPDGKHVYVECKALRGRLTPAQESWQKQMREQGVTVLTVRSIEELRQGLRAVGVAAP